MHYVRVDGVHRRIVVVVVAFVVAVVVTVVDKLCELLGVLPQS
jgi:hypothetical protein